MYNDNRLDWLQEIYPEYKNQEWHNDNVYHPDRDVENRSCYTEVGREIKFISPKLISGIEYAFAYNCYKEINWLELFMSLKKLNGIIKSFRTRKEVKKHIHTNIDLKTVEQFGDMYFTTSGQHRLCLAKFLDVEYVEVQVIKHELDIQKLVRKSQFY